MYYCTLAEAKDEMLAVNATDDDKLTRNIWQVCRRIDLIMGGRSRRPYFGPWIEERKFPLDGRLVDSSRNTLLLKGAPPLLAITSATADGTSITSVVEGYPQGDPFFRMLRITSSGDPWYSYIDGCEDPAYVAVNGVWGYHSDYANAWLAVDTLVGNINASVGSFIVNDVDGDDPYGIAPRISRGALLKIDDEIFLATDTTTSTNTVTVRRPQNGSSAATHNTGATVYAWQTEEPIRRLAARQAGLLYARRGAYQVETVDGVGTVSYPQDLLNELSAVLSEYMNG